MDWFTLLMTFVQISPKVKGWIDIGLPILGELQKSEPHLIPAFEAAGSKLFPKLAGTIHVVAAAADAIFDPHGTMWTQHQMNVLMKAGLDEDGDYGELTRKAVTAYQTSKGKAYTGIVDGWMGPLTEALIMVDLAALAKSK